MDPPASGRERRRVWCIDSEVVRDPQVCTETEVGVSTTDSQVPLRIGDTFYEETYGRKTPRDCITYLDSNYRHVKTERMFTVFEKVISPV